MVCTLSAQLRVNQNGNVSIGTTLVPLSPLSISCQGNAEHNIYSHSPKHAMYCVLNNAGTTYNWGYAGYCATVAGNHNFNVGIWGDVGSPNLTEWGTGRSFGVLGAAGYATSGWNYGVFGRLMGTSNGAGVFGTANPQSNGMCLNGRYAGYFQGDVEVFGNLNVTDYITGIYLGEEAESASMAMTADASVGQANASTKLSTLSAIPYFKSTATPASVQSVEGDTATTQMTLSAMEAQNLSKVHYALSAEQLEEVYPELVYTDAKGRKLINYVEMIPLLVQSISELKAEIATLRSGNIRMAPQQSTSTDVDVSIDAIQPSLSQNIPNPFKETAIINVSIPMDAASASLCVYDMTGKQIKKIGIAERGNSFVTIQADELGAGMFLYGLIVDGQLIETKRMIVEN